MWHRDSRPARAGSAGRPRSTMMSTCPPPRHARRRRTGATPRTSFRVPRASRFDSGRFDSGRFESGDDIGEQLVLAPTDLVAQLQLLLLEPGDRKSVV